MLTTLYLIDRICLCVLIKLLKLESEKSPKTKSPVLTNALLSVTVGINVCADHVVFDWQDLSLCVLIKLLKLESENAINFQQNRVFPLHTFKLSLSSISNELSFEFEKVIL